MIIKKNLLILFGGCSSEHDISIMSVKNILNNIDRVDYNIYIVGITKNGRWMYVQEEDLENGDWIYGSKNAYLIPDAEKRTLIIVQDNYEKDIDSVTIDVCFPVLHGKYGEDGTMQGLFELAGIPYVGCGVLSSSVCMDKISTKLMVDSLGIRQAKYVSVVKKDLDNKKEIIRKVEDELGYPVFIKPSNAGSSIGVSKANNEEELLKGLELAYEEDNRILIEETIVGREIECAVFSDGNTKAFAVGEIVSGNEFYDFEGKYYNNESKTVVDPELPEGVKERIMDYSVKIFDKLDCYSLSRVDFFVEDGSNEIVFNEINTMPGFTNISMYPMLANFSGISSRELIKSLLDTAFKRRK